MQQVKVVTDSSVGLPDALIEEYGIRFAPLQIIFGDKTYRDRIELSPADFYSMLEGSDKLPTTSAPTSQDFLAIYKEAANEAKNIVCLCLTQRFSTMGIKSALQAKEEAREFLPDVRIEVFDSRSAVGGMGLIVLAAAQAAQEGKTLPEVIATAESVRDRINVIEVMDTLKYLAKGGRIGKAAHWAGSLLNIKPILEVSNLTGAVEPVERIRTKQKALERLLEIVSERVKGQGPLHAIVDHSNTPVEAERLKEQVIANFDCYEIYISDITPACGVHLGPRVVGVSFYAEDKHT